MRCNREIEDELLMSTEIQQLVAEVSQVTGAQPPEVLDADSPVLRDEAINASSDQSPYLIGLIGGKEVGKSALVNALIG
jgi:predicted GTPase